MKNPNISVIISTYNRPETLEKAIKSVLNQSYDNYEIVVVDDHSTKPLNNLVKKLDPLGTRINLVRLPENWGNDTRPKNVGIDKARGKYIAFLDDDNEYRKDHLRVLINAIEKYGVDIVYGDRWIVFDDKSEQNRLGVASDYNPFILLRQNYIDTSDVLVKKKALLEVGGFDERYKKYIDWNLWVRMSKYGHKFVHTPIVITDYHIHSGMKSNRKEDEQAFSVPKWSPIDCEIVLPYLGEVHKPKVAIYSLTYNRLDFTKKCFESLHKTAGYKFDHYVVDNGSTDGTRLYLRENEMFAQVIHNSDNKGISIASNQIVSLIKEKGDYDIIMKVDNDALFKSDGWLKKMVEIWESNRRLVLSCYIEGLVHNPGGAPRETYGGICGELVGMTKHIGGICHFVDARAYKDWKWDENSTLHGLQDLEFSQYLTSQGYQHAYLENYYCEHIYGTDEQAKIYPEYFEKRKTEKTTRYEKN